MRRILRVYPDQSVMGNEVTRCPERSRREVISQAQLESLENENSSLLPGICILVHRIRQLAEKAGGDWDPLGVDCGSNKSCLKRIEMHKLECIESTTTKSKQTKAFFCCSNQANSG